MKIDLPDPKFQTYRNLNTKAAESLPDELSDQIYFATPDVTSVSPSVSVTDHPLVKAGLIPDDLVNVLVVPPIPTKSTKREAGKARVLTSEEVQREIEEKKKNYFWNRRSNESKKGLIKR
jgi:hypothetical protein